MEEYAGDEAAVVGGEGVGALGGERGEECDEVGIAVCEELLQDGLAIEVTGQVDEAFGEAREVEIGVWG